MKPYVIFLILIVCSCIKKQENNSSVNYVELIKTTNQSVWLNQYDKEHFSITYGSPLFEQRFFKVKSKEFSIYLIYLKNYDDERPNFFLRIDNLRGETMYDTILGARTDVAQIILSKDKNYYYPRKSKYNFSIYKSGSADGCYWAYHVIEYDTLKNKFYYKELYEERPCDEERKRHDETGE